MAPVFDNGTSLGHELQERKIPELSETCRLERYIRRGTHHLRWNIDDPKSGGHISLILKLCERFPHLRNHARAKLDSFNSQALATIINDMTHFDIPVPLSPVRAKFVCRLTEARHKALLEALS